MTGKQGKSGSLTFCDWDLEVVVVEVVGKGRPQCIVGIKYVYMYSPVGGVWRYLRDHR